MRLNKTRISLSIVLGVALIAVLPLLPRQAQARGFGGFHGGGGVGGGFGGAGRGFGGVGGPGYGHGGVGGWGHYGAPAAGAAVAGAALGVAAGLAIGATIASLPAAAQPLDVGGQTYYYDGANYYQPCAQGSDMNYCVVSDSNQ